MDEYKEKEDIFRCDLLREQEIREKLTIPVPPVKIPEKVVELEKTNIEAIRNGLVHF